MVLTAARHWPAPGTRGVEPLPTVEALLVTGCAVAAVVARLTEIRTTRRPAVATLLQLGASPRLLAGAAAQRWLAGGAVLLLTGGLTAALAAGILR